jgi:hypothetical protein
MKAALFLAMMSGGLVSACICGDPTVQAATEDADVVFRGTLIALRPTNKRTGFEGPGFTPKIAVFRVSRVWKGDVEPIFEMPAMSEDSTCRGFASGFLKVGAELIVYAFRSEGEYFTGVCTRTRFMKYAAKDFQELGPGEEPKPLKLPPTKAK